MHLYRWRSLEKCCPKCPSNFSRNLSSKIFMFQFNVGKLLPLYFQGLLRSIIGSFRHRKNQFLCFKYFLSLQTFLNKIANQGKWRFLKQWDFHIHHEFRLFIAITHPKSNKAIGIRKSAYFLIQKLYYEGLDRPQNEIPALV